MRIPTHPVALIILATIDLFSFGLDQNQSPTNPADVYDKTAQDARQLVPSSEAPPALAAPARGPAPSSEHRLGRGRGRSRHGAR